jgi:hypothetical protein
MTSKEMLNGNLAIAILHRVADSAMTDYERKGWHRDDP